LVRPVKAFLPPVAINYMDGREPTATAPLTSRCRLFADLHGYDLMEKAVEQLAPKAAVDQIEAARQRFNRRR
jgi:hypothetical protein